MSNRIGNRKHGQSTATSLHADPKLVLLAAVLGLLIAITPPAQAQTYTVLYNFCSQPNCTDGEYPAGPLVQDNDGNLYGTTLLGGSSTACPPWNGCGTVFKLAADGTYTVLHSFAGSPDGAEPNGGLVLDADGNLYGTTSSGGTGTGNDCSYLGCGTVFKLAPDGTETVLYSFTDGADGAWPQGGLALDAKGNLYGAAFNGGPYMCENYSSCGTIFKVSPSGKETTLWDFTGDKDDGNPNGGLVRDAQGDLYGTTAQQGDLDLTAGTVFELTASGKYKRLHAFNLGPRGGSPLAGLVRDAQGNLYGTTYFGGILSCYYDGFYDNGCGVVFEITATKKETVLHKFTDGKDGALPMTGLVLDGQGNLYGTTQYGGDPSCYDGELYGCGVIFEIPKNGKEIPLYAFTEQSDGGYLTSGLIVDSVGNLYGVTGGGVNNRGVLYKLTP